MTKGLPKRKKAFVYAGLIIVLLMAMSLTAASIEYFIEYSSFTVGLTKAVVGIIFCALIDDTVFNKIDTIEELKKGNIAYALVYLSIALIISACIGFA